MAANGASLLARLLLHGMLPKGQPTGNGRNIPIARKGDFSSLFHGNQAAQAGPIDLSRLPQMHGPVDPGWGDQGPFSNPATYDYQRNPNSGHGPIDPGGAGGSGLPWAQAAQGNPFMGVQGLGGGGQQATPDFAERFAAQQPQAAPDLSERWLGTHPAAQQPNDLVERMLAQKQSKPHQVMGSQLLAHQLAQFIGRGRNSALPATAGSWMKRRGY